MGEVLKQTDGTMVQIVSSNMLPNGLVHVKTIDNLSHTVHPSRIQETSETMAEQSFELASLKNRPNCILYTKKGIRFDHERINVQAHVLLFVGDNPRKLCFNTYNGQLGKGKKKPDFEGFCNGADSKVFYKIENMEKETKRLLKQGYEQA